MKSWFLVYTKPKHEEMVSGRLSDAGFQTLNAKISERKFSRGRISEVTSPLFPCYLFVNFDKLRHYHLIRYTRGIKRVLGNDSGPAEVDERIIESITARMDNGVISVKPVFRPGEEVTILAGPFEGLSAVFEKELNGMERVSVLLKAMNIRMVVDGSLLQRSF